MHGGIKKILILLIFVGFLNLFFFHAWGLVSFVLFITGLYLFITSVLWKDTLQFPLIGGFVILLSILNLLILYRDNGFVLLILGGMNLAFGVFYVYLLSSRLKFFRSLLEVLLSPFYTGLRYITAAFEAMTVLLTQKWGFSNKHKTQSSTFFSIMVGFVIAVPIVLVLLGMFSSADPIFGTAVGNVFKIFDSQFWQRFISRFILSSFMLVVFTPFLLMKNMPVFSSPLYVFRKIAPRTEMTVVMTLVSLTLLSFLLIQWPYVFASVPFETDLSRFGVKTYSEYVQKGFVELIIIAAFIYTLIWIGLIILKNSGMGKKPLLYWVQFITLGELGIFIVSIFRRVWLYQSYHGWSLIRIYGSLFLVWLSLITLTLFLRHIKKFRWIILEGGLTVALLLTVGIFNAEDYIVRTHPPTVNKRVDYMYLSRMSADGYRGWIMALNHAEDVLLQRNYILKGLLDREDRREIAYAGFITNQLTGQYDSLIRKYGTAAEIQIYHQDVYRFLISANQKVISRLQANPAEQSEFKPSLQIIKKQDLTDLEMANLAQVSLDKRFSQYASSPKNKWSDLSFYVNYIAHFDTPHCDNYPEYYCLYGFYRTRKYAEEPSYRQYGSLDYIYTWSGIRSRVYAQIKNDIPPEKLLRLQSAYFDLVQKIRQQPDGEQDFELDVSRDTPLLGSLPDFNKPYYAER